MLDNEQFIELEPTDVWNQYQKCIDYMRTKGIFAGTEQNENFFHGKQWENAKLGDMKPIVINIIKPIVKYKIGVINARSYSVVFTPSYLQSGDEKLNKWCELLSKHVDRIFEMQRLDRKNRIVVKDSCVNSEGIMYFYYDTTENEIVGEIVDKNNICYGNEASSDIQSQPFIIIAFRRPVADVKEEAEAQGMKKEELEKIVADEEYREQAGFDGIEQETTPMCLVLLKLYKKENSKGVKTVHFKKSTMYAEVTKEIDTGLKLYPVEHFIWEDLKGSARGIGEVEANIPNQMEINKTEMRRAIAVKQSAYPKMAYNTQYIKNRDALHQTGADIQVEGSGVDDVRKQVGYLNATSMSADSKYLLDELINYTQNFAGAGDNASGNIDVTKTSAKAIIAVQEAQQQPLNEQLYNYKDYLESVARICLDMLQNYSVNGLVLADEEEQQVQDENGMITSQTVPELYSLSYEDLNSIKANVKIEITPKSAYDKMAVEQSLDNLLANQLIEFEEYVNALPYDSAMPKKKLEEIVKKRKQTQQNIQAMQNVANEQMGRISALLGQQQQYEDMRNIANMKQQGQAQIRQFQNAIGG